MRHLKRRVPAFVLVVALLLAVYCGMVAFYCEVVIPDDASSYKLDHVKYDWLFNKREKIRNDGL